LQFAEGNARISPDTPVLAGTRGRWTVTVQVGDPGISAGGGLRLFLTRQVMRYGDHPPQIDDPQTDGYMGLIDPSVDFDLSMPHVKFGHFQPAEPTLLEDFPGAIYCLEARSPVPVVPGTCLRFALGGPDNGGRFQLPSQTIGPLTFWIMVDAAGDDQFLPLREMPSLTLLPGPAEHLHVTVPSRSRRGDLIVARYAWVDRHWNPVSDAGSTVEIGLRPVGVESVGSDLIPRTAGVYEAVVSDTGHEQVSVSNPVVVSDDHPEWQIYWGEIHGHTVLSDGFGRPDAYYLYGRDVMGLDFCALSDHDFRLAYDNCRNWHTIERITAEFHDPGRFVTLLGFEATDRVDTADDRCADL